LPSEGVLLCDGDWVGDLVVEGPFADATIVLLLWLIGVVLFDDWGVLERPVEDLPLDSVSLLVSYGLKLATDFVTEGVLLLLLSLVAGEILSRRESDFLWLLSKGGSRGLELGESAPIWLHVCASRAKGLFFASN
jgi:hypothetical protein